MRNILLTISYNGTDFCGWQRQKGVRTVQGEMERALSKLHGGQIVQLHGSGRTDSGVHAIGQAANFFSPIDSIPAENYSRALNSLLPPDVRVMRATEVHEQFSARFSATSRTYRYFFWCKEAVPAALMPFVWRIGHSVDAEHLNRLAACLHGEIDCASFAAAGDSSLSTFRYIESAVFFTQPAFPAGELLVFEIAANAFLWKMVRTIAGSLMMCERFSDDSCFADILKAHDRTKAGPTAPPQGLFLWHVGFEGKRRHI